MGGRADLNQLGNDNQIQASQRGGRYPVGIVALEQTGDANTGQIAQAGGFSEFRFVQRGSGNQLQTKQTGRTLELSGSSSGNDNQIRAVRRLDEAVLDTSRMGGW